MENLVTKTVIIGAGISGISASLNLLKNGYDEVLVFEAHNRIGGRIHTIPLENGSIELGAQYIHGQVNNPIFYFARDNKLIDEKDYEIGDDPDLGLDFFCESQEGRYFFDENKKEVSEPVNFRINNIIDKLVMETKDINIENVKEDMNLGDYLFRRLEEMAKEEFSNEQLNDSEFKKTLYGIFDWRCKLENLCSGCSSVCDLSLRNYRNYTNLEGLKAIQLKNGYKSVIDKMIEPYEKQFYDRIKLDHALTQILLCSSLTSETSNHPCEHCQYVKDKNKIVLKLNERSENKEVTVICDHLICTVSLGVLKATFQDMVKPVDLIPKEKLDVISRLGFGLNNKIFLVYDKPLWDESIWPFVELNLVRLFESKKELFDSLKHNYNTKQYWFRDVSILEQSEVNPNVVQLWIGGTYEHEKLSDEQIIEDLYMIFRKFIPHEPLTKPTKIIRTKWCTDEFFRGAYSYCKVGGHKDDHELLSKPIVFNDFAGEATIEGHFGCVHGAYMSGIRESNRILEESN